jgi:hypothetical protein
MVVGRPHTYQGDRLTWFHEIPKEVVDGEQVVTPASRAGDAGFFKVRTREGKVDTGDIDD